MIMWKINSDHAFLLLQLITGAISADRGIDVIFHHNRQAELLMQLLHHTIPCQFWKAGNHNFTVNRLPWYADAYDLDGRKLPQDFPNRIVKA
ncbi:hypothetical protein D3C78_1647540 [compost metagenome]